MKVLQRVLFSINVWGAVCDFPDEAPETVEGIVEGSQILRGDVVLKEKLLQIFGQGQGTVDAFHKMGIVFAVHGPAKGLAIPGDEIDDLFLIGKPAVDHGIGPGSLEIKPVFPGDGEEVGDLPVITQDKRRR